MVIKPTRPGFWAVSAVDEDLRVFMGDSYTDSGMMFNTYLAESERETVLFGAPPVRQTEEWLRQIGPYIRGKERLTFVSFCDRNDSRIVQELADRCETLTVIGSMAALYALEEGGAFRKIAIRGRRVLELGGRKFIFETEAGGNLCIFCEEWKLAVTGKCLGSYCAVPGIFLHTADRKTYLAGAKNYCRDTSGKDRGARLRELIAAARSMQIELLCPACGPVADTDLDLLYSVYEKQPVSEVRAWTVALLCAPGLYTELLAEKIAEGVTECGNIRVDVLDLSAVSRDEVLERTRRADAVILGTPETNGRAAKAVYDVVTSLTAGQCKGKPVCVFYSADSQNCEREALQTWLNALEFDTNTSELFCVGKPDDAMLNAAFEYGFAFGCSLRRIPNPRQPKLVKCLVCGEIFDASLGVCPVCGVGLDQCVPAEEDAVVFRCDTDREYLILGGGVAAVSAAQAIRGRDGTGTITILSAEKELPLNRPLLTKDLKAAMEQPETLTFHEKKWYDDLEIRLVLGQAAAAIDPNEKAVSTDCGAVYHYDKLIYALGGECFIPPFKGGEKPGVITVRHLPDIEDLAKYLENARNAVVIGGGALGLEAAGELHRFGVKVTVLESAPQIAARQLDGANAAVFRTAMERMGVSCWEGVSIEEICGEDRVTSVRLADGREFPADVVVVSCGIRCSTRLAQSAGIAADRGVIVNERMETNVPDIYACGDCAQLDGVNWQLWQEAADQGRTAGANAAGEGVRYANRMFGCSIAGFGATLYAIGDVGKKEGVPYRKVELKDDVRNRRETYWFMGESLTGAIILNRPEKTDFINNAVMKQARYEELFP